MSVGSQPGWRLTSSWYLARRFPRSALRQFALGAAPVFILLLVAVRRLNPVASAVLASVYGLVAIVWRWTSNLARRRGTVVSNIPVVETPRLRLRPPRADDAPAIGAFTDSEILAIQGWTRQMRDGLIQVIEAS